MCTVVLASGLVPDQPLVVVANRDEQLDRPSRAPFVWPAGFLAPRDERAGGTWLGVTPGGLFVGITNRFLGPRDAARRSRGDLVVEALAAPSARAAHARMAAVDPRAYNAFHLVCADASGGGVLATVSDGATLTQLAFGEGLCVVTERSFGAADDTPRLRRIEAAWSRLAGDARAPLDPARLTALLAEHDAADPLGSTCIHLPELGYGTRSAMVLSLGAERRMLWAEGPPCTSPFADVRVPGP